MRPDAHKQKKNTAYKKKHGINSPSKSDKTSPQRSKGKSTKPKTSVVSHGNKTSPDLKQPKDDFKQSGGAKASVTPPELSSSESDDGQHDRRQTKASQGNFRRREIVSNWERYRLEPEPDERYVAKGDDYQKLLDMAGEAMSHFRFKDELQWEEETNPLVAVPDILSLDTKRLSESIGCIPAHKQLSVDSKYFPEEQFNSMVTKAKENEKAWNLRLEKETLISETETNSRTYVKKEGRTLENMENINKLSLKKLTKETVVLKNKCSNNVNNSETKLSPVEQNMEKSSFADDDFDNLLNIPNSSVQDSKIVSHLEESQITGKTSHLKALATDTAALEDWLDSVLDE